MQSPAQQLETHHPGGQRLDWHNGKDRLVDAAIAAYGAPGARDACAFDESVWQQRKDLLLGAAADIQAEGPCSDDTLYLHPHFSLACLPRHETASRKFSRINEHISLELKMARAAGAGLGGEQLVPHGAFARAALIAVCTLARRANSARCGSHRVVDDLLGCVGLDASVLNRSQMSEQLHRLVRCNVRLRAFKDEFCGTIVSLSPIQVALGLGASDVALDEQLLPLLVRRAVCLDRRAVRALHGSDLATDIYLWLAKLLPGLSTARQFSLALLRQQFGEECSRGIGEGNFHPGFLAALREALTVYPQARVLVRPSCLVMLPSSSPARPRWNAK